MPHGQATLVGQTGQRSQHLLHPMDALKSRIGGTLLDDRKQASLPTRAFDFFLGYWHESAGPPIRRRTFFLICLAILCGATVLTGAVPTRIYGHDIFFLLGNSWRIVNGMRPHVDFYSPWGPVTFLTVALGLKLSHNTVNGVGYGTAVFGLVTGLWSYALTARRMESSPRIVASRLLTALVLAPYPDLRPSPSVRRGLLWHRKYRDGS
jgi:hypothetical protein